jgi:hypothetical protein
VFGGPASYGFLGWGLATVAIVTCLFGLLLAAAAQLHWVTLTVAGRAVRPGAAKCDLFLLWQLAHGIPSLDLTDTFKWSAPMAYTAPATGVMVLAFKVAVIVPVGVMATYWWRQRDERARVTPADLPRQVTRLARRGRDRREIEREALRELTWPSPTGPGQAPEEDES